jgi:hypothetical protein
VGCWHTSLSKLKDQYTLAITIQIDSTLWITGAKSFNDSRGLGAVVDGVGTLTPSAFSNTTWAEFGARVGYTVTDKMTFDVYSGGIAGRDGIDSEIHSGLALRLQF